MMLKTLILVLQFVPTGQIANYLTRLIVLEERFYGLSDFQIFQALKKQSGSSLNVSKINLVIYRAKFVIISYAVRDFYFHFMRKLMF